VSPPPNSVEPATGVAGAWDAEAFLHRATLELQDSIELEPTFRRIARLAVPALGDTCAVHLVQPDGRLVQVAEAAVSPSLEAQIQGLRKLPLEKSSHLGRVLAARTPQVIESFDEDYYAGTAEPVRGVVRELALRRAVVVPLVAHDEALGTLSLGTVSAQRAWDAADLRVLEELARRAGMAVAHARLLERTRRTADRLTTLERTAVELGQALTQAEVAHVVLAQAAPAVRAHIAAVYLLEPAGAQLTLIEALGYTAAQRERLHTLPLDGEPLPATEAVRTDRDLWMSSRAEYGDRYPSLTGELLQPSADLAVACLVLRMRGKPMGLLVLSFDSPRHFDAEERGFLRALADHCAQALERARLFEEAQKARKTAERAEAEQRFLADASAALAASLDFNETLRTMARLAVGVLGDLVVVDGPDLDPGAPLAVAAARPELEPVLYELRRRYPLQQHDTILRALRTGEPGLYQFDREVLASYAVDAEHLRLLEALAITSSAIVPLRARGATLGVLTVASGTRRYGERELALLHQLAGRAAVAVDNARLFEAERRAHDEAAHSTHLLHALVAASPLSVMVLDLDGTVQVWNPAAERMYGWSAQEVLGRFLPAVPDARREEFAQHLRAVAAGKVLLGRETVRHRRGGEPFDAALWTARLEGPDGKVRCMSIVADVTERKRAERGMQLLARAGELLGSTAELEPMLQGVAALAVPHFAEWCLIDRLQPDGTFQRVVAHADPRHADLAWAMRRRTYASRPEHSADAAARASALTPELLDALAGDASHRRQLEALGLRAVLCVPLRVESRMLGTLTWLTTQVGQSYGEPELRLAEDLARRVALSLDRVRLFDEARQSQLRAEDANRTKDEFLATLSHELRTPLTSILGYAHMLRRGAIPEDRRARAHEVIERNAKAQAQLVGDMLDLARIATGKLRLEVQPVDAAAAVEAAVEAVRLAADEKGVAVEVAPADPGAPILADPDRLQQVLWNLLTNAIKFSPRGARVRIRMVQADAHTTFEVADDGEGIPAAFMPRLFERFSQADGSSTRAHGGLGLGLSLVRHLVELHGGTVSAQSDGEGHGATFTVRLPGGSARLAAEAHPVDPAMKLRGVKVLLVEDDAEARELIAQVLELAGAKVRTAPSAQEALQQLALEQPDLIISDLAMPEQDGLEFLRRVRALPAAQGGGVPALALSAYARAEDRERALQAGFQHHLAKPVEPEALLRALSQLLA